MTFPSEFWMVLIHVSKLMLVIGQPIRIQAWNFENRPEFYGPHILRNAKMEFEIYNYLLGKGTEQSLVDYENLKSDQDINMVFELWRYFDAIQHDERYLFGDISSSTIREAT